MEHTHFVIKRRVTIKDLEGNYKSIERPKRIKPWWFMAADGTLCLSVFYGSKRIELIPGKNSISVKNMNDLATILMSSNEEAILPIALLVMPMLRLLLIILPTLMLQLKG